MLKREFDLTDSKLKVSFVINSRFSKHLAIEKIELMLPK